jgi:transposase
MQHYVRLDVSVKETSVCIIDKAGKVMREVKVATKPVAILAVLTEEGLAIERIGLEAGPLSQWLYSALAEAGLPVICVETRHMKAALSAQINKSDRITARWPAPQSTATPDWLKFKNQDASAAKREAKEEWR